MMEERSVLEYAEVIIDRQRDKINELEREIIEQKNNNEVLQKNILKSEEENKALRLELNRKGDSELVLNMHMAKENDFLQKINLLENQLLKRDSLLEELNNLIKKRKVEYDQIINEYEKLKNTVNTLKYELNEERKKHKLKEPENKLHEKKNEDLFNLYKNNREELNVTKRCLIQMESELDMLRKQNEQQKLEIQKLYKIINCMNKEKILVPPIILTTHHGTKLKTKGEFTTDKSTKNEFALTDENISMTHDKKSTQLVEKDVSMDNLVYDNNILKLNYLQNQEENKNVFNKILETLKLLQDIKGNHQHDNYFFFSSHVLHYCKKPTMLRLMNYRNMSENYNGSKTYKLANGSSESYSSTYTEEDESSIQNRSVNTYRKKINKKIDSERKYNTLNKKHTSRKKSDERSKTSINLSNKEKTNKKKKRRKQKNTSFSINKFKKNKKEHQNKSSGKYSGSFNSSTSERSSFDIPTYREYSEEESNCNYSNEDETGVDYEEEKKFLTELEKYKKRFIGVTSQHIYIFNKIKDEEPLYIIKLQNLKKIKLLFNNKLCMIEHFPYENATEKHYIFLQEDDKALRMFYALQYAGFIKEKDKLEEKSKKETKTDSSHTSENEEDIKKKDIYSSEKEDIKTSSEKSEEPFEKKSSLSLATKADIFTPDGKDVKGNNIAYLSHDVLIKMNIKNNIIKFANFGWGDETYVIDCEDANLTHENNKFTLRFYGKNTEHIIIPKNEECSKFLFNAMEQLKWREFVEKDETIFNQSLTASNIASEKKKDMDQKESVRKSTVDRNEIPDFAVSPKRKSIESVESENQGSLFVIKDDMLYLTKFGSLIKPDLTDLDNDNILKIHKNDVEIVKNDDVNDLTVVKNPNKADKEMFVYNIAEKKKYDFWIDEFKKNNFKVIDKSKSKMDPGSETDEKSEVGKDPDQMKKKKKKEKKKKEKNQVVVIEKGILSIYKDYGSDDSEPFMQFNAGACIAETNEKNGEIRLIETKKDKKDKIVLDCLNRAEFVRWENALGFGGFLKGRFSTSAHANLKKHIFPINLFDDFDPSVSLVKVENGYFNIYPSTKSVKPLFSFDKNKIELVIMPEYRKIRIYLQRETIYEQRFDFTITLARDFNYIKEQINKERFFSISHKKTQRIKKPFVLCRKNLIVVHKDKYSLKPEISFEKSLCTAVLSKENLSITFQIKENPDSTEYIDSKTIILNDLINFNKWIVTLKLATFIETHISFHDTLNFPSICFGHTCPEATQLIKKDIKFLRFLKKKKPKIKKIENNQKLGYNEKKNISSDKKGGTDLMNPVNKKISRENGDSISDISSSNSNKMKPSK